MHPKIIKYTLNTFTKMEITGRITHVLEARGGTSARTGNAWKVQSYVLETEEQYPKHLCFEVFGEDKINLFNIQEGQVLTVSFDVDAHEYQGRWYNQIRAWKVEPYVAGAPAAPVQQPVVADPFAAQPAPAAAPAPTFDSTPDETSDLPF